MNEQLRTTSTLIFTVRLWTEYEPNGETLRGSVRNVDSGANRSFHRLDDLGTFLTEQIDDHRPEETDR